MANEKEVVCETTVCDGSRDVVTVVMNDIKTDVAAAAEAYGKYVVYAVVAFIGFQIFQFWRKSRRS